MSNKLLPTQVIHLADLFSSNISTRAAVKLLEEKIDPSAESVRLDFSKIDFISRSFTHELLRFIANSSNKIELYHLNTDVEAMLKLVKKAKKSKTSKRSIPLVHLSDSQLPF